MEDSVTEDERLVPLVNHNNSEDRSKRDSENEEKKQEFVSTEKLKQEDLDHGGGDGEGIISSLISTLIAPLSPRNGKATTEHENGNEVSESDKGIAVENNDGEDKGVFTNLVSHFFHSTPSEGEEGVMLETEKKNKEVDEIIDDENKSKRLKTENGGGGGGGGVIHDIVSHLPHSLPDDAAPTADEATILINSLVRD